MIAVVNRRLLLVSLFASCLVLPFHFFSLLSGCEDIALSYSDEYNLHEGVVVMKFKVLWLSGLENNIIIVS